MPSRYWTGPNDRHYGYSSTPRFDCPVGQEASRIMQDEAPTPKWAEAAALIGLKPKVLARLTARSSCGTRDRDDAGELTDRCVAHGCKMAKRGYRAFVDEPKPEKEWTEPERASVRMGERLFGGAEHPRRVLEERYYLTKKEARGWALQRRQEEVAAHA